MSRPVQFSVIIPLYNKRAYIRRAVDSVLSQTFTNFELIVVDDGSTDDSYDMIGNITDERVRLVRQANSGEGAARNRGIAESLAPWIAFLDADDMWLTGHLEELRKIISEESEAGLISSGNIELVDGAPLPQDCTRERLIERIDYFERAARHIMIVHSSSAAVRRDLVRSTGGFGPAKAGADLEFWSRIALMYPVAVSNKITSVYCRGTGGVMETRWSSQQPKVQLRCLGDVSPSVRLLDSALKRGDYSVPRKSIEVYINSRLFTVIRGALYRYDIDRARSAARLAIGVVPVKLKTANAVLHLPKPLVLLVVLLIHWHKRLRRIAHHRLQFTKRFQHAR